MYLSSTEISFLINTPIDLSQTRLPNRYNNQSTIVLRAGRHRQKRSSRAARHTQHSIKGKESKDSLAHLRLRNERRARESAGHSIACARAPGAIIDPLRIIMARFLRVPSPGVHFRPWAANGNGFFAAAAPYSVKRVCRFSFAMIGGFSSARVCLTSPGTYLLKAIETRESSRQFGLCYCIPLYIVEVSWAEPWSWIQIRCPRHFNLVWQVHLAW